MDELRIDGAAIEVRWWHPTSPAGSRPIVLLHEGLGSVSAWREFPAELAARTRRAAFAYSRRGHGRSARRDGPLPVTFMHDEATHYLPRVLDAAGIERAVLFGHSDGASIGLLAAAAHGSRVEALVLEAPHVFVEAVTLDSIARVRGQYATTDLRERLARHHAHVDEAFHGWADVWLAPAFLDWNLEDCLAHIQCPVLVIQGSGDEYGTDAQIAAIHRGVHPPPHVCRIQDCGHSPHRQAAGRVLDATATFLAGTRPVASEKALVSEGRRP